MACFAAPKIEPEAAVPRQEESKSLRWVNLI